MVKAVWDVDQQLANICNDFDFLLQVTPVNNDKCMVSFSTKVNLKKHRNLYIVLFHSIRHMAKRQLFQIPIERIEDPTLAQLFREQQLELDRKFTMLIDRENSSFFVWKSYSFMVL